MTEHTCTRHEPGTVACYRHGCPCTPCRAARTRAAKLAHWRAVNGCGVQPACGVQRRLQALMFRGWPLVELGRRLGYTKPAMTTLLAGQRKVSHWDTYTRVHRLFIELGDVEYSAHTRDEKRASTRARLRARREGWAPAAAWDGGRGPHGIDNPDAVPHLRPATGATYGHTAEDLADLIEAGVDLAGLIERGHTAASIEQALRRGGRRDLWARIKPSDPNRTAWKDVA